MEKSIEELIYEETDRRLTAHQSLIISFVAAASSEKRRKNLPDQWFADTNVIKDRSSFSKWA